ncbi:MAG: hypothetical protein WC867_06110 [Candidatus Pacearchaeota archaeon]|jgi:hypothetical protein
MGKKKVTLSIDSKTYSDFQKYCEENAIMLSKKIELVIRDIMKNGKKNISLFLFGFFMIMMIGGILADNIHSEGFESGSISSWTLSNNNGVNWGASTLDPYSGSYHIQVNAPGSTEPAAVMEKIYSTNSYTNISVRYYRKLIGLDTVDWFSVEWFDGSTWHEIERSNSANDASYVEKQFNLTSSANNNSNFKIKFECTAGAISEYCRIDNLTISGIIIDSNPPGFSDYNEYPINGSNYQYGQDYYFNITITESNINYMGAVFNGNNLSRNLIINISNIFIFNKSNLATGTYEYFWYGNDSNGNYNRSQNRSYVISKSNSQTSLFFDKISPQDYTNSIIPNCSVISGIGSAVLRLNGNIISSGLPLVLGAGTHVFNCSLLGTQNYSYSENVSSFVINKISPANNMTITGTSLINYGVISDYIGGETNSGDSDCIYTMDKSNTIYRGGETIFNYSTSGCSNYSSGSYIKTLTVNKIAPTLTLLLNNQANNVSLIYQQNLNASAKTNGGSINLFRDSNDISSINNQNLLLGAGNYEYRVNSSGNENYTDSISDLVLFANINKANPNLTMNITITPSSIVNYGVQTSTSTIENNIGDSDLIYELYRDGILVSNPNIVSLNAGIYNYFYNTSGGENYSAGSINKTLIVNKISNSVRLFVDNIYQNITSEYLRQVNVSGNSESGEINLFRNGLEVSSENSLNKTLAAGYYEYFINSSGDTNYIMNSSGVRVYINVTKANSNLRLYLNNIRDNLTINEGEIFAINSTSTGFESNIQILVNGNIYSNGNSSYYNLTSFSQPGNYNITARYLETENYTYSIESYFVNVNDITPPVVNIYSPESKTYGENNSIGLNYSISDFSGIDSCYYQLDNGIKINLAGCMNSSFNTYDGNHQINFFANDSFGNLINMNRSFSISTILAIDLISPVENFWSKNNFNYFNYSINSLSSIRNCSLYMDYNGSFNIVKTNMSFVNSSGGINLFNMTLSDGSYKWNVKCYAGNYQSFAFNNRTVKIDTTLPVISNLSLNDNMIFYKNISVIINFSVDEINLDGCFYSFDNGITNISIQNCLNGENYMETSRTEGNYNISIYSNDSANNINRFIINNITILSDTVSPSLTINEPVGVKSYKTGIPLQFSASDNVDSNDELTCWFNVTYKSTGGTVSGLENVLLSDCSSTTFNVPSDSEYVLNLFAEDTSENLRIVKTYFNVTTSSTTNSPSTGGSSSGGGGGGILVQKVNLTNIVKLEISKINNIIARTGDKKTLFVLAKNSGNVFLNKCKLVVNGEINSWIYSKQLIGLSPGENINFIFDINIPEETISGEYKGSIEIVCNEVRSGQNLTVSIPKGLESIKIKEVEHQKGNLAISYTLNSSDISKDISVNIWLIDKDKIEIKRIEDKFKIESIGENERIINMEIPENIIGVYYLYFALSSNKEDYVRQSVVLGKPTTTGMAVFENPENKKFIYIVFIVIVLSGIFFVFLSNRKSKPDEDLKMLNSQLPLKKSPPHIKMKEEIFSNETKAPM